VLDSKAKTKVPFLGPLAKGLLALIVIHFTWYRRAESVPHLVFSNPTTLARSIFGRVAISFAGFNTIKDFSTSFHPPLH
jgi:hypothetical protein